MWPALIAAGASMLGNQGGGGGGGGGGFQFQGIGNRMGGIANGLFNLFGAKNPSDAANNYLQQGQGFLSQIGDRAGQYMNPYMEAGHRAMPTLEREYNRNINDPTGVMNQIGQGFQQSPGYQWQVDQATEAANRAAAAGGMAGTPAEQQRLATTVNGLANQDYYNYVDRGLGSYNMGMGGLSDINHMGFNASSQMVQAIMAQLMAQAQMSQQQANNAYEGVNTRNQQVGGGIGSITGALF